MSENVEKKNLNKEERRNRDIDNEQKAFRERKNLTLICQDDEIAEISEKFNFKYELLQKMNACTVYNVEFNN